MPPRHLQVLGEYNNQKNGIVEAYIYSRIEEKHDQLLQIYEYLKNTSPGKFQLDRLLDMFMRDESGLVRSMDKVYEIVVYALFLTLTQKLGISVEMKISNKDKQLIEDFDAFTTKIYGLNSKELERSMPAFIYRVGATNAADRGLDMWSTFGAAIQVKHLTLSEEIIDGVASDVQADRLIIVCREVDSKIIDSIFTKTGTKTKVQAIVTQEELLGWYNKCLSTKYVKSIGNDLLRVFINEFQHEFPFAGNPLEELKNDRGYSKIDLTKY